MLQKNQQKEKTVQMNFQRLFQLELDRTITELKAYQNEANMWLLDHQVNNSAGTLALHLAGNIQHFIGHVLGKTSYVRQRDEEFSLRGVLRSELILKLEDAKRVVDDVFPKLTDEQLKKTFPVNLLGTEETVELSVTYLLVHLGYHHGQISYHRRLLDH
jgi:hypothetical protein